VERTPITLAATPVSPDLAFAADWAPLLADESTAAEATAAPVDPDDPLPPEVIGPPTAVAVPRMAELVAVGAEVTAPAPPVAPESPAVAVGWATAADVAAPVLPVFVLPDWAVDAPELPLVAVGFTVTVEPPPPPPLAVPVATPLPPFTVLMPAAPAVCAAAGPATAKVRAAAANAAATADRSLGVDDLENVVTVTSFTGAGKARGPMILTRLTRPSSFDLPEEREEVTTHSAWRSCARPVAECAVRRITTDQRRALLARRHHLVASAKTDDVVAIAGDMVALHGTDPSAVFLSAAARMRRPSVESIERALYDDRSLVRTLCMRRTMFVLPVPLVPVVQAACTDALVAGERRRTLAMLEGAGEADAATYLRDMEQATLTAIEERGEVTGAELSKIVPGLNRKLAVGEGKKWEGTIGVTTRVLFLLSTEQRIVRGRPRGGWTSSQYRWSPMSSWLPGDQARPGADEARVELTRRWLHAFGPATVTDLKWWSGLTLGQVRKALGALDIEEVDLDGATGIALAHDIPPTSECEPWVALLPSLDPTTMGWKERGWYLGGHGPLLFDTNGNAGPTVWYGGRIVGGWAQRRTGEVVFELLEDVGEAAVEAIASEAARLGEWLGEVRVAPRFPTPLQRRLVL